jgi:hypothetical protein
VQDLEIAIGLLSDLLNRSLCEREREREREIRELGVQELEIAIGFLSDSLDS